MKIRTDFVTNSSSSSFTLVISVKNKNGEEYSFKSISSRLFAEEFAKHPYDILNSPITSQAALMQLLDQLNVSYSTKGAIKKILPPMKEVERIDINLVWDSQGESSGCTVYNDTDLRKKADALIHAKGDNQEAAKAALEEYLNNTPVSSEGAWVNETWPTGFFGDSEDTARYGWEKYKGNVEKLAKLIEKEEYDNNDLGVETLSIFPAEKRVTHRAELIVDGRRDILKTNRPKKKQDTKSADPIVLLPLKVSETEDAPNVALDGYIFSYNTIDQVPKAFYQSILNDKGGLVHIKNVKETIGNFTVSVQFGNVIKYIEEMYRGIDELEWFMPNAFYSEKKPYTTDRNSALSKEQIAHRAAAFYQIMQFCTSKAILKKIVEEYPKKKNGLLYKGRVLKIAWMYAVNVTYELSEYTGEMVPFDHLYQLIAKAESETELNVFARFWKPVTLEEINNINDLALSTNLFSRLE